MEQSILTSVKKILGIDESYVVFDLDIITHINSAFSTLHQLGLGPTHGFRIEDATAVWSDFTGDDPTVDSVRTYVSLKVRSYFDPPITAPLITAMEKQTQELEWRLNVNRESNDWVDPTCRDNVNT